MSTQERTPEPVICQPSILAAIWELLVEVSIAYEPGVWDEGNRKA